MFPQLMLSSFPHGKHCFQRQFLFSRCKLCLRYTAENFNENPSMRALAIILRAWASVHSSNFCEQFEQRPNFANTFKLIGIIRYPVICIQFGSCEVRRLNLTLVVLCWKYQSIWRTKPVCWKPTALATRDLAYHKNKKSEEPRPKKF